MPSLSGMLPFVLRTSNVHIMPFFFFFSFNSEYLLPMRILADSNLLVMTADIGQLRDYPGESLVRYSKTHARFRSCLRVSERVLTQG